MIFEFHRSTYHNKYKQMERLFNFRQLGVENNEKRHSNKVTLTVGKDGKQVWGVNLAAKATLSNANNIGTIGSK
jgi:ABC-type molybdenum transport system ATPase subunit/photorepair protein PhrA